MRGSSYGAPGPRGLIVEPVSFWAVRLKQYERAAGLLLDSSENVQSIVDPKDAAQSVGLRYVSDARPGIRRRKTGTGFSYARADGSKLSDADVLKRIKALVIPPAWVDVWISPFADGHLQATGRDAKGRKQYRYHALFREVRESTKYEHVVAFADELPTIRKKVHEHMGRRGLPREKVLATVIHLLETTLIRVGNEDYAKQNNSYGLTTLKNRHVAVDGNEVRFRFTGKSGKQWSLRVRDRRVAKIIKACQDLPGQELLQYVDEAGDCQDVTSSDVNAYLKEITGKDVTAKDFRTWAGTVLAAMALNEVESFDSAAQAKRNLRAAIAPTRRHASLGRIALGRRHEPREARRPRALGNLRRRRFRHRFEPRSEGIRAALRRGLEGAARQLQLLDL